LQSPASGPSSPRNRVPTCLASRSQPRSGNADSAPS
jgi:hypothetical protein